MPTTYHSCSYSNNSDEEKWHQHIADGHIPINDGRGLSSAVHCICSGERGGNRAACAGLLQAANPLPMADSVSSGCPLVVYVSSLSFMWLPHGITALPNQREIWWSREWKEFAHSYKHIKEVVRSYSGRWVGYLSQYWQNRDRLRNRPIQYNIYVLLASNVTVKATFLAAQLISWYVRI